MPNIPDSLFSINLEKQVIAGILNHPNILIDLANILEDKCFFTREHRVFFSVIHSMVMEGKKPEKAIVAQKVKDLGLKLDLEVYDYLDAICFSTIQPSGIVECVKELIKLKIKRDLYENAAAVQAYIKDSTNDPIDKIISHVDSLYHSQIGLYSSKEEPIDLYSQIEPMLKELAKNPKEEVGFRTAYPEWNRLFGGIRTKQTTNIISRSGEGKSCYLFNMAKHICKINNIKCLYIDTEMDLDLNMFRAAAAEMNINAWHLETGRWSKNTDLTNRVLAGFNKIKEYNGSIYHIYLPNKPIKETISLMKRWYYKTVGRGNKCAFVYDYLKITEALDKNKTEYAALGDMLNYLNELGHETDSAILTAGQQNRAAENQGQRNDDSTTAAVSDRINHLVGFNAVFRKKTQEELSEHGMGFGSHLLKPFKTSRVQGIDNYNMNSSVRVVDQQSNKVKYKQNFINYGINHYAVTEYGTYADIIKQQQLQANLQSQPTKKNNDF